MTRPRPCDRFEPGPRPRQCATCGWIKGRHKRKKPLCPTTGKFRYPTSEKAKVALHRYLGSPKEPLASAQKLMPYHCVHCRGWHLGHDANGDDDVAVAKPRTPKKPVVREVQP